MTKKERPLNIRPNNLIPSVAALFPALPTGISTYHLDKHSHALTPLFDNSESYEIGIEKASDSITVAGAWTIEHLTTNATYLHMAFNDEGSLRHAYFNHGIHRDPHVSVSFTPKTGMIWDRERRIESNGYAHMTLVNQISSLSPEYHGDHKKLTFKSLNDYTRGQVALVFEDGKVPNIDIQQFIYESLFLGNVKAIRDLSLPTLTFDRQRDSYQPDHSTTYLVHPEGSLPPIQRETTIHGLAIAKRREKPYRISVEIVDAEDVVYAYSDGDGPAVKINGITTVEDALDKPQTSNESFVVLSSMAQLISHPERVPAKAFAELFSV